MLDFGRLVMTLHDTQGATNGPRLMALGPAGTIGHNRTKCECIFGATPKCTLWRALCPQDSGGLVPCARFRTFFWIARNGQNGTPRRGNGQLGVLWAICCRPLDAAQDTDEALPQRSLFKEFPYGSAAFFAENPNPYTPGPQKFFGVKIVFLFFFSKTCF